MVNDYCLNTVDLSNWRRTGGCGSRRICPGRLPDSWPSYPVNAMMKQAKMAKAQILQKIETRVSGGVSGIGGDEENIETNVEEDVRMTSETN